MARSKWKARLEKKRKKEQKRKKQAIAELEYKGKRKEREEKRKEEVKKKKEEVKKKKERMEKREKAEQRYFLKHDANYWAQVWKSDGFDVVSLGLPNFQKMVAFKCEKPDDCPLIVRLYAKMGLHRYNMLQGTNLQPWCVERYNRQGMLALRPSSYYITLLALDPATGEVVPFQASSHEITKHKLYVRFYVARPLNTGTVGTLWDDKTAPDFTNTSVPKWPSHEDDQKQFYLVQKSEWEENDWIRLYLELIFVTTNRRIPNPKLSDLKIVEVMLETKDHCLVHHPLKGFRDATVYIKYHQDLGDGRFCKRRAIIRRCVDLRTERMCLVGDDYLD